MKASLMKSAHFLGIRYMIFMDLLIIGMMGAFLPLTGKYMKTRTAQERYLKDITSAAVLCLHD